MRDAFSSLNADFSGMSVNRELYISEVVHKGFISVDEADTEAAAATAVSSLPMALPVAPEPPPFVRVTLDRPFIFVIRDIQTRAILFIGRVMNPAD